MDVLLAILIPDPNTTMVEKEDTLKELLSTDFEAIFEDMDLFVLHIPSMVKLIGLNAFLTHMDFTKTQYYRRANNPDKWVFEELKKAKSIFVQVGLGKR